MPSTISILQELVQQSRTFILYGLLFYIAFYVAHAVYNVYFHPLSRFPGPKLAAASDIPYVNALARGRFPYWISSLHSAYRSSVIRISPNELSFINPDAWKDIYANRHGQAPFERDERVYGKPPNGVHTLLTAPKEDHSRVRRVLEHAFSDKAYKDQEPLVIGYIDKLISVLHRQIQGAEEGKVDLVKWYNWMSFDVIGDLSFGQSFRCLETETYHPWVEMIFGNLKGFTLLGACKRFTVLRYLLPFLIPKRITRMIGDHWAATTANVNRRLELGTERPDFMSPILEHMNETKASMTHEELRSNASLFIIAGSESIATVLSGTTYYLLKNPKALTALTEEIYQAFTSENQITPRSVSVLPYLQACLSETNRIYPTALTGQAMRAPSPGSTACGFWIPENTGVIINQYAAYRSPTNFADPNDYVPERWLDDPRYDSDNRDVFHPFSLGARNCIGKYLGDLETRLVLARMIWNFDMKLCEETEPRWDNQKVYLSWQKKPLIVKLQPKLRSGSS